MPDGKVLDDPVLSDAEHGPGREHEHVGYTGEMRSKPQSSIQRLQANKHSENLTRTQSAALEYMMEVIPPAPER